MRPVTGWGWWGGKDRGDLRWGLGQRSISGSGFNCSRRAISPYRTFFPPEDEKVSALTAGGIAKELLPRRLYQGAVGAQYCYFPHKLSMALDGGRATFLFVQAEDETDSAVRTWGGQH